MRGHAALRPEIFNAPDRPLTKKQMRFVEAYVDNGGHQSAAAITAGYPETNASSQASRLIRNPLIQQEIMKLTLQRIGLKAVPALQQVVSLAASARSEYVRLEASKDLLDRAGFKPPDRVDHRLDADLTVTFDILPTVKTIEGGSKTVG